MPGMGPLRLSDRRRFADVPGVGPFAAPFKALAYADALLRAAAPSGRLGFLVAAHFERDGGGRRSPGPLSRAQAGGKHAIPCPNAERRAAERVRRSGRRRSRAPGDAASRGVAATRPTSAGSAAALADARHATHAGALPDLPQSAQTHEAHSEAAGDAAAERRRR